MTGRQHLDGHQTVERDLAGEYTAPMPSCARKSIIRRPCKLTKPPTPQDWVAGKGEEYSLMDEIAGKIPAQPSEIPQRVELNTTR